ncbi:MAG TPA: CvpA family protein [Bryobacteraceae bacterium]|nr:CvpA family protein [Bryobacteraceae bacterium]
MTFLDLLLGLVILSSIITGFMGGFARVGVGFCAVIAGLLFGFWFYGIPGGWINSYFHAETASNLLGFLLIFVLFMALGSVVGFALSRLFKWTGLSFLDHFLGAGFGLVRGGLVAIALVSVLLAFSPRPLPGWIVNSRLLPYVAGAADVAATLAPNSVKQAYRDTLAEIRKLWEEQIQHKPRELEPGDQKSKLKRSDA